MNLSRRNRNYRNKWETAKRANAYDFSLRNATGRDYSRAQKISIAVKVLSLMIAVASLKLSLSYKQIYFFFGGLSLALYLDIVIGRLIVERVLLASSGDMVKKEYGKLLIQARGDSFSLVGLAMIFSLIMFAIIGIGVYFIVN